MAFSVNGDFSKDIRSFAEVIDKRYAYTFKRFEFLTFEVGNLTFGERASIHVAFFVLERLALGDLDGTCCAVVVACLDEVGAIRPAKGDISFIAVDAVLASGRDAAAVYRDSVKTVDAVAVVASGRDAAAVYRDSVRVDAEIFASGLDRAAAYRDIAIAGDAVTAFASGLDRAATYRDSSFAGDALAVACGRDRAATYRDSSFAVDAVVVSVLGRDSAAAYRDISFTVDALAVACDCDTAVLYLDSSAAADAVAASALDLNRAADYRDIIAVDAVVVASGSDAATAYRDSFITVDAVAVASGLDRAAAYRDFSSAVDAVITASGRDFQSSAFIVLLALPVNGQISRGVDSIILCFNLQLRTVRKDEMSVTVKLDLARVFHLALHHVPAASEVAHVG